MIGFEVGAGGTRFFKLPGVGVSFFFEILKIFYSIKVTFENKKND